jgi:peptide/nickel transport system ATP-binding protein
MEPAILSVRDLRILLNKDGIPVDIIRDISFEIHPGETLALVGESGSGKSITARSIMQLLDEKIFHQAGRIILKKKDGSALNILNAASPMRSAYRGNDAAMIFQEPMTSLNPVMRIGAQLTEVVHAHQKISRHDAIEKAIRWLEKVQLPHPADMMQRFPHQLSGGQKQRVMIAMAMINQPSLLIADEPTTALDTTTQKEILQLISSLQKSTGMSLLFITHDLGIVKEIADHVIVMNKGIMVEQGKTENIFQQPTHPYTKALINCRPVHYIKGERIPVGEEDATFINELTTAAETDKRMEAEETPVMQLQNLCITYKGERSIFSKRKPDHEAVKHIDMVIHRGETVGLAGESGCGKTTLARTILGLIKPTEGVILFNGKPIHSNQRKRHQEIQLVFQDPYSSLNPRIQIGKAIEEPLLVHGRFQQRKEARDYVQDMLNKVQLDPDHYHRYPHQFSGGQRQRIVIARALAQQPDFIIWDEAISALDVRVQAQILNLINDLKNIYHFSSLFISHDLSVIKYLCDRMYIMEKGRIIEDGRPEDIWEHPQQPYSRRLLEAII